MTGLPHVDPGELRERSGKLPPERFIELYRLYEKLREKRDVTPELEILRARLVQLRPSRPLTFTRLLCQPFEAFLANHVADDQPGGPALARRHCRALGRLVAASLPADRRRVIDDRLRQIDPEDPAAALSVGKLLWPLAATVLRNARLAAPGGAADPRRQFDMLAGCLEIGDAMTALARGLPNGRIAAIDRSAGTLFAQLARGLPDQRFGHARYLLALLLRRVEQPARLLEMLADRRLDLSSPRRQALIRMARAEIQRTASDAGRAVLAADDPARPVADGLHRLCGALDALSASGADVTGDLPAYAESAHRLLTRVQAQAASMPAPDIDVRGLPAEHAAGLALSSTYLGLEQEAGVLARLDDGFVRLGVDGLFDDDRARLRRTVSGRLERLFARSTVPARDRVDVATRRAELYGLVFLVEMLDGPAEAEKLRQRGMSLLKAA
ncbi:MAG: hypothetical protein VYB54_03300 [Pseudomonadota bacterium]|nr:hypothetical protein [Pseudomonadota bacterium]